MEDTGFSTYAHPAAVDPKKRGKTKMTLNHNLSLAPLLHQNGCELVAATVNREK
jgi:hypothetical protein